MSAEQMRETEAKWEIELLKTLQMLHGQRNCRYEIEAQFGTDIWQVLSVRSALLGAECPERTDMQTAELIAQLRKQAKEIADANEPGWGNTMTDAANALQVAIAAKPTDDSVRESCLRCSRVLYDHMKQYPDDDMDDTDLLEIIEYVLKEVNK